MVQRNFRFNAMLFDEGQTSQALPNDNYPLVVVTDVLSGALVISSQIREQLLTVPIESTREYDVTVSEDPQNYVFTQWAGGAGTGRTRRIFATDAALPPDITFNAYFTSLSAQVPTVELNINGLNEATGQPVTGLRAYVVPTPPNGISEVFVPGKFDLEPGVQYELYANDFISPEGNTFLFSRFSGQPINGGFQPQMVTINQNESRTVYYDVSIVSEPTPPPPEPEPEPEPQPEPTPSGSWWTRLSTTEKAGIAFGTAGLALAIFRRR